MKKQENNLIITTGVVLVLLASALEFFGLLPSCRRSSEE
jgi:hypothetical protein